MAFGLPDPYAELKKMAADSLESLMGESQDPAAQPAAALSTLLESQVTADGGKAGHPSTQTHVGAATAMYTPGYPKTTDYSTTPSPRDDLTSVDTGTDDISLTAIRTLGDYVLGKTSKNKYRPSDVPSVPSGLKRGEDLDEDGKGGANPYIKQGSEKAEAYFENISGGGQSDTREGGFFSGEQLQDIISKTAALGEIDGSDMLRTKNAETPNPKIAEHTEGNLNKTNRYSSRKGGTSYLKDGEGKPWTPYRATEEDELLQFTKGLFGVQTGTGEIGKYDPEAPGITVKELKAMALQVMLTATSHRSLGQGLNVNMAIPGVDQFSFMADIAALWPGMTQIGAEAIPAQNLRVRNTFEAESFGVNKAEALANAVAGAINQALPGGLSVPEIPLIARLFASYGADDLIGIQSFARVMGSGDDGKPEGNTPGLNSPQVNSPRNASSYGSMNSFLEHFDGPAPFGMLLPVLYAIIIIALLSLALDATAMENADPKKMMEGPKPDGMSPTNPGSLAMGSYGHATKSDSGMALVRQLFNFPYMQSGASFPGAVVRGLMAFYGMNVDPLKLGEESGGDLGGLLDTVLNLALAPGFYATVTKQVLRDFEQITLAATDFTRAEGVTGVITQIFKLVFAITESTTWQFVMKMAMLGDIMFQSNFQLGGLRYNQANVLPLELEPNIKKMTPALRTQISRFYDGKDGATDPGRNPLSLTLFNSLILANSPLGAAKVMNVGAEGKPLTEATLTDQAKFDAAREKGDRPMLIDAKANSRFGRDLVRMVEEHLDTEYTPFYIQDLRTNEIIALPAFITSIGDSYSVDYGSSHGYGRTDPVMTYSKTTRSVDLTFLVAAMGPEDHDYMWGVINRLTMMLYPQRSSGRIRTFENGTRSFIQPFSQVPTASPVVRLRLGELFHSNYSVEGLSRLFGLGPKGAAGGAFNLETTPDELKKVQDAIQARRKANRPMLEATARKQAHGDFKGGKWSAAKQEGVGTAGEFFCKRRTKVTITPDAFAAPSKPTSKPAKPVKTSVLKPGAKIKITGDPELKEIKAAKGKRPAITAYLYKGEIDLNVGGKTSKPYKIVQMNGRTRKQIKADATTIPVEFYHTDILGFKPTADFIKQVVDKKIEAQFPQVKEVADKNVGKVSDFFSAKKNAIVRSFATAAGKGLAGVITQMSLGAFDTSNWGTDPQKADRVPHFVEVSISFQPIHDLPLGLGADGAPLAPVYPTHGRITDPHKPFDEKTESGREDTRVIRLAKTIEKNITPKSDVVKAFQEEEDTKPGNE